MSKSVALAVLLALSTGSALAVTTTENFNSVSSGNVNGSLPTGWTSTNVTANSTADVFLRLDPASSLTYTFTLGAGSWDVAFDFYAGSNRAIQSLGIAFDGHAGAEPAFTFSNTGVINPGSNVAASAHYTSGTFSNLGAGTYNFTISGPANGNARIDDFSFTKTQVSAVPEPETYAMMLAGLGAVGFMARRKTKR